MEGEDKKSTYMRIFLEIIAVMVTNISDQFSDIPKLKFLTCLTKRYSQDLKLNSLVMQ
jgi:hypothetical protein